MEHLDRFSTKPVHDKTVIARTARLIPQGPRTSDTVTPPRREVDHTTERGSTLYCRTQRQARLWPWLPQGPKGASMSPSRKQVHVSPLSGVGKDARSRGERASPTLQRHRNRAILTEGGHGCRQGKLRPGPAGSEKTQGAKGLSWTHPPRCFLSRGKKKYSFNI